ncbi:MAG TPA: extracellular matrix/biofilm biosynthesis regulator RemA family protein [Syntrophomonadaceae bacterium]|nr:extracellular matrix/biofilm biosynthesis regulator RemA family protein [Syntrophomonadaceae bacterium]
MYIHLGNNHIISSQDVIAILNLNTSLSEDVLDIMEIARSEKKLVNISEEGKEKSLIICNDRTYISPISSITLYKRGAAYTKEV